MPDNPIMKSMVQNRIHISTFRCDIFYISLCCAAFYCVLLYASVQYFIIVH